MLNKFHAGILLLATSLSPFAAAVAAPPTSGLLISRPSSSAWQLRLIAGDEARQFSGIVDSSAAFGAVTPYKLEKVDSATLVASTSLGANFSVWPGGTDGVDFSVVSTAKLCLRDTGSSGVQWYLGDSLATAVPVNPPVALNGSDACGGTPPPVDPPPVGQRKFNAGHYIALMRGASTQSIMDKTTEPGVAGLMKRYTWRLLEPTQGAYNFSEVKSDLSWAQANGMHLIVMIEDKTFKDEQPTPSYLAAYTAKNKQGGYTAVRWNPTIVARKKELIKALGQQVDSNPAFEGIATQESAPSLDDATLNATGYTPEKYRDALIDELSSATVSLPTSRVFWFMNFFPGNQNYIASVASAVASKGVIMGGPDVMPDDDALQIRTYPFYEQFAGKMPLFGQVEPVCYSHLHETSASTKYWTMPELFRYARDNLHVNYMIWVRVPNASPSDSYDYNDALPVIAANPVINP